MVDSRRVGPAFDTNTLIRPTQRKLVGVWMDDVDLPTLVLPSSVAPGRLDALVSGKPDGLK